MVKKKLLSGILSAAMIVGLAVPMPSTVSAAVREVKETVVEKSTLGNPIAGFNEKGEVTYGGDPTIFVDDDDTVYLYVGHDYTGSGGGYTMPNYLCYSTKDLKDWKYEGVIMEMSTVSWGNPNEAWASQMIKRNGQYYLYFCSHGAKKIGVAKSSSPTGPFVDIGHPLITNTQTNVATYQIGDTTAAKKYAYVYTDENGAQHTMDRKASFGHEDIDPTVWIDTDEEGNEHVYLMWGNSNLWMCELNDDMTSVKDQNGDGQITQGEDADIWYQAVAGAEVLPANGNMGDLVDFTEAPWLYRRKDASGKAYGQYYVFFATHWREEMAYATTDDIRSNVWTYGSKLMEATATSNTNHPAVFDFKGHTYFIYHNGSLPGGSGYRRVICIEEMKFNEDGSIDYIPETSTGLTGIKSWILDSADKPLAHESFHNSIWDNFFPIVNRKVAADDTADASDMIWEIEPGKADKDNDAYVTIEAFNKPGMYLTATSDGKVVLSADHNDDKASGADGTTKDTYNMTFRTLEGFAGHGVTLESVAYPRQYVVSENGALSLSEDPDPNAATFEFGEATNVSSISAQKTARVYEVGSQLNVNDIRVRVAYENGSSETIRSNFTTNAASINMNTAGTKKLDISYTKKGVTKTCSINLIVVEKVKDGENGIIGGRDDVDEEPLPKRGSVHAVGVLNYKVTKTDEYNTDGTNGTVTVTGLKKGNPKSVTIPDEVTIDGYSFMVTEIAAKAFQKKSKIKTVTIGNNVKKIGKNAFAGIYKKATFKVSADRYKAVKKLLKSSVGFKKTMKIKKTK